MKPSVADSSLIKPFLKPYLSLHQQVGSLRQRGLIIADVEATIQCLRRNGYYRMSAYWYPFWKIVDGKRADEFLTESTFENARKIYQFDKDFKLILMDAIERIEVAVRADIALHLGAINPFAHRHPVFFRPEFVKIGSEGTSKHTEWLTKFDKTARASSDEFIYHHQTRYGNRIVPIWVAIELWDFGMLSKFYSGLTNEHRIAIATTFKIPDHNLMLRWLHTINYVRNVIAHHSRLWNRNLAIRPSRPKADKMPAFDIFNKDACNSIYMTCCIISYFSSVINPQNDWQKKLKTHLQSFPVMSYVSVKNMGCPSDWETHSFWN